MIIHSTFEINPHPPFNIIRQIGRTEFLCSKCKEPFAADNLCIQHEDACNKNKKLKRGNK